MLIPERPHATGRAQDDLLTAAFQFQRVTRFQLELLSQGLGNDDSAGFVHNETTVHFWYNNMVRSINQYHLHLGEMALSSLGMKFKEVIP